MRPPELKFEDVDLQKMFRALVTVLYNISLDNMKRIEITGTTNASADTSSMFRHALGSVPSLWFPLEGRVYVPRHGMNENEIDIRSTVTSEPFRIMVIQ